MTVNSRPVILLWSKKCLKWHHVSINPPSCIEFIFPLFLPQKERWPWWLSTPKTNGFHHSHWRWPCASPLRIFRKAIELRGHHALPPPTGHQPIQPLAGQICSTHLLDLHINDPAFSPQAKEIFICPLAKGIPDQAHKRKSQRKSIKDCFNTPLHHTPGNPPSQLWKKSLFKPLGKGLGCVPKVCWNKLWEYHWMVTKAKGSAALFWYCSQGAASLLHPLAQRVLTTQKKLRKIGHQLETQKAAPSSRDMPRFGLLLHIQGRKSPSQGYFSALPLLSGVQPPETTSQ